MKRYFLILAMLCLVMFCGCNNSTHRKEIPRNEIHYTSSDGKIVEPGNAFYFEYSSDFFGEGVSIVSNIYENGEGIITCDGDITSIGHCAFAGCQNLTSITIPDSVTSIEEDAFDHCESLKSITIPDSVTSIGDSAFYGCTNLTGFYGKFASEDHKCLIVNGTLISFAIGCGITSYTIPDGVTAIGDHAFNWCKSLTSITIPDSVTSIGDDVFGGCSNLTGFYGKFASEDHKCLIVNGALIDIIDYDLTSYTIPDGVTAIIDHAFAYNQTLISITIPDSIIDIGYGAFYECSRLRRIYCKAVIPPFLAYIALDSTYDAPIIVPAESVEAYKTRKDWSGYADRIIGYNF